VIIRAPRDHSPSETRNFAEPMAAIETALPSVLPRLETASLFREHGPYVWRVLRRLGVAENDVADVCQEIFVIVHRKLGEFEGRSSIRTWIYGICVRASADHRKRAHHRKELLTDDPPEQTSNDTPDRSIAMREARALLDGILDRLDDEKRAVFVLYEIEQLPMNEVVSAIGCPLQTGYSRLHAARAFVTDAIRRLREEKGATP
jgi:RNA polymerase sigma-70 factor (ECF subfamily)